MSAAFPKWLRIGAVLAALVVGAVALLVVREVADLEQAHGGTYRALLAIFVLTSTGAVAARRGAAASARSTQILRSA